MLDITKRWQYFRITIIKTNKKLWVGPKEGNKNTKAFYEKLFLITEEKVMLLFFSKYISRDRDVLCASIYIMYYIILNMQYSGVGNFNF